MAETKKQIKLINTIDSDFDPEFYISEYPDVNEYYKYALSIPFSQKLYHHYIHFGKNEGRFKNQKEKNQCFLDKNIYISNRIDTSDLVFSANNLECICLLSTVEEIKNKKYFKFIEHLISKTQNSIVSKQIDFRIILNRSTTKDLLVSDLAKIFSDIKVVNLKLSRAEDIYISKLPHGKTLPDYGLKSGPNITFFQTLKKTKKYNTVLLLETDCILEDNWLDNIYYYTKYANGFLISGATYDGLIFTKAESTMMTHINGGTALYATGHPVLQNLIEFLSVFLQKQIKNNMPGLAYDYALKLLIEQGLDGSYHSKADREIWQFISRNYLPCKLIINCSTNTDAQMNNNNLLKKYNYSILHKKSHNYA